MKKLTRDDWASDVKKAINDFLEHSAKESAPGERYAVFDFDNTAVIFDSEDIVAVYQLQKMAFAIKPEEMADVLATDLGDIRRKLRMPATGHLSLKIPAIGDMNQKKVDERGFTYNDWIEDITCAYDNICQKYQVNAGGVPDDVAAQLMRDPDWMEFATKLRAMFDVVLANETKEVAFLWLLYWFKGMTDEDVYALAHECFDVYSKVKTSDVTWYSPEMRSCVSECERRSRIGAVSYTWRSGISPAANVIELMRTLNERGIDVWICSASSTAVVCAGVDYWGMRPYVKGVLAVVLGKKDGRIIPACDLEAGAAEKKTDNYESTDGEKTTDCKSENCIEITQQGRFEDYWIYDEVALGAETEGPGKSTAITNVLCNMYGHGPSFCAMDSTGDFNFCTEYESTELTLCMNTARYGITNGGALIGRVAIYQRDVLGYDFEKARESGDTFYVLQGHNENGLRHFISSNATVRFGENEERLFAFDENENTFRKEGLSTGDIINRYCIHTEADDPNNSLNKEYGFLKIYSGYHSR